MDLSPFIADKTLIPLDNNLNISTSLSMNSKTVTKGGIFVAISGFLQDGTLFIEEALTHGANAIVAQKIESTKLDQLQTRYPTVSFFETKNARQTLSRLAAAFYPLQPNNMVAVTGTNGKTSVVSFIRQIWASLDIPAASFGTLGLIIEKKSTLLPIETGVTNTPDPIKLHEILQNLKKEQIEHVAFEASSHGLHQHRLDAVRLKAAVFTNFSNDHLDYHDTLEGYFNEKSRLFKELVSKNGHAVLNADIAEYDNLFALCQSRGLQTITFGKAGETIRLLSLIPREGMQDIRLDIQGRVHEVSVPLVGEFQVYNIMAALGAVIACGGNTIQAVEACTHLKGVPGRLEKVAPGVYVDYSHKPEALAAALRALRPHTKGKLWVVFGCGGNRDTLKRPMMGKIADKLADNIIITDDNPRHEDPVAIRQQILAKCPRAREIGSRSQAIETAVKGMDLEDIVLIAGKGHETYQLIGDQALPFNDGEEVQRHMKR